MHFVTIAILDVRVLLALMITIKAFILFGLLNNIIDIIMFQKEHLLELAQFEMPFGKYSGHVIIDLPEEYLLWFREKGFPEGRLGLLMALALEIKVEGLESLIEPLKGRKSRYTFH